ncbi:MAG: VWA domain-containing protein [Phycisphaerae bacterium]
MPSILLMAASPWRFANPEWLALLALAAAALPGVWLSSRWRREGLHRFLGDAAEDRLPRTGAAWARAVLAATGAAAIAIAAARPQSDPVAEQVSVRGRDLVFVVDVSRSMLSRDVVPDRLSRTKLWINDLVNTIGGDRVGLVAFAGVPVVKCPLTLDHGFFRMELDELSPASAPRGGTLIGDAIRKAMTDVLEPGQGRHRDIILFTDGEDQGSFPVEAAKAAGEAGIRIIAVGIGSELEGSLVPADQAAENRYVEHDGSQVRSRLDGTTLAAITNAAREAGGQGVFLHVGTGTMDFDTVYRDLIASAEQGATSQLATVTYRELFPWFLGLAAICLVVEPLVPLARRRPSRSAGFPRGIAAAVLVASVAAMSPRAAASPPPSAPTPSAADTYNEGRTLFLEGKLAEAAEKFKAADLATRDASLAGKARYNLGQSLYRQAMPDRVAPASPAADTTSADQRLSLLEAASRAFRAALEVDPSDQEAARNVEICRRRMQEIREEERRKQEQQQQSGDGKDKPSQDSKGRGDPHDQQSKELSDLAKRQRDAAEESAKAKASEQASERARRTEEAAEQQQQVNDATKRQQSSSQRPSEQAARDLQQAREAQDRASEALKGGDLDRARQEQEKAAEHLEAAASAEREASRHEQASKPDQQGKQGDSKPQQPSYDQTASDLLDRERRLREARRQAFRAMRGKPQPVERDW